MADGDIIIKKVKKVSGGGHHGGAWKVAYADFVTAMMAFFLLMWLLNATTEDQRKGIADYFNPTIPVSQMSGGGAGALNGDSVLAERTLARTGTGGERNGQLEPGETADTQKAKVVLQNMLEDDENAPGKDGQTDGLEGFSSAGGQFEAGYNEGDGEGEGYRDGRDGTSEEMKAQLETFTEVIAAKAAKDASEAAIGDEKIAEHIITRASPEGIVIELVDTDGNPLFEVGSSKASPMMEQLMKAVADTLSLVENNIVIVGHTDGLAFSQSRNYSNWELSTDRAHAARRLMEINGLSSDQINEVSGKADTEPLVEDPFAPQNRRISITILRS